MERRHIRHDAANGFKATARLYRRIAMDLGLWILTAGLLVHVATRLQSDDMTKQQSKILVNDARQIPHAAVI